MRRRRIRRYESCPVCGHCGLRVEENGRICRHSFGFGCVEKVGPGTRWPKFVTTICTGSGMKILKSVKAKGEASNG